MSTRKRTFPSLAARRLAAKGSQTKIADAIGASQQAVSLWLAGERFPSGHWLLEIQRVYRIPVADWYRAPDGRALRDTG